MLIIEKAKLLTSDHNHPFGTVLEERLQSFKETEFKNYPESDFIDFLMKYRSRDIAELSSSFMIFPILILLPISTLLAFLNHNPLYLLAFFPLLYLFAHIKESDNYKRKMAKKLLENEVYKKGLPYKMFEKITVDKEILKIFANKYGKEETVKLLDKNKSPTYEDIYDAISLINQNNRRDNKAIEEIADCLLN